MNTFKRKKEVIMNDCMIVKKTEVNETNNFSPSKTNEKGLLLEKPSGSKRAMKSRNSEEIMKNKELLIKAFPLGFFDKDFFYAFSKEGIKVGFSIKDFKKDICFKKGVLGFLNKEASGARKPFRCAKENAFFQEYFLKGINYFLNFPEDISLKEMKFLNNYLNNGMDQNLCLRYIKSNGKTFRNTAL